MALYRRKPNVIEAVQFDSAKTPWPAGITEHENYIGGRGHGRIPCGVSYRCGDACVRPGDWIDVTDPVHPRVISVEAFEAQYEKSPGAETVEARVRKFAERAFQHRGACPGTAQTRSGFNVPLRRVWAVVSCDTCGASQDTYEPDLGVFDAS